MPVIIGETHAETESVFTQKSNELNSEITFADQIIFCQKANYTASLEINVSTKQQVIYENLKSGLNGNYQLKNIATVLASITKVRSIFGKVSDLTIRNGIQNVIANTGLLGRWQIIQQSPFVICDTGHNVAGITEIIQQLSELNAPLIHFVLGFVGDKDVEEIAALLPSKHHYFFCQPSIPRAMKIDTLKGFVSSKFQNSEYFDDVESAYLAALKSAKSNEVVFVGGSTFVVADLLTSLEKKNSE